MPFNQAQLFILGNTNVCLRPSHDIRAVPDGITFGGLLDRPTRYYSIVLKARNDFLLQSKQCRFLVACFQHLTVLSPLLICNNVVKGSISSKVTLRFTY